MEFGSIIIDADIDAIDGSIISVIEEVDTSFIEQEEREINSLLERVGGRL